LAKFKIAETENFSKSFRKINDPKLFIKINNLVYPILRENPSFGPNIKKLKGEYENIYRFRISKYRLFYIIDVKKNLIFILDVVKRKDAY
jgi:mRNA interferase RelE/StbE